MRASDRLGDAEEAIVQRYLVERTQDLRDQIVTFSTRIIKLMYSKYLRGQADYDEYFQDAVARLLIVIDRFDPTVARGSFVDWMLVSMDKYALSYRFREARYYATHQFSELAPSEDARWDKYEDYQTGVFSRCDRGSVRRAVCGLRSRMTDNRSVFFMRVLYAHLLTRGEFPTFEDLARTRLAQHFGLHEIYRLRRYAIVECRLSLKELCHA